MAVPVLDRHNLVRKVALVHVKVQTVHGNQFYKRNVISLFLLVRDVIAKHEPATLACMRMEINEHFEAFVLLCLLHDGFTCRPNGGIICFGGREIHSIQVTGHSVETVITARNTIWVQNHDNFEYVVFSETFALLAAQIAEHFKETVEHVRSGSLSWMHPGCHKDNWLLFSESEGSCLWISLGGREAALGVGRDRLDLISDLIS